MIDEWRKPGKTGRREETWHLMPHQAEIRAEGKTDGGIFTEGKGGERPKTKAQGGKREAHGVGKRDRKSEGRKKSEFSHKRG